MNIPSQPPTRTALPFKSLQSTKPNNVSESDSKPFAKPPTNSQRTGDTKITTKPERFLSSSYHLTENQGATHSSRLFSASLSRPLESYIPRSTLSSKLKYEHVDAQRGAETGRNVSHAHTSAYQEGIHSSSPPVEDGTNQVFGEKLEFKAEPQSIATPTFFFPSSKASQQRARKIKEEQSIVARTSSPAGALHFPNLFKKNSQDGPVLKAKPIESAPFKVYDTPAAEGDTEVEMEQEQHQSRSASIMSIANEDLDMSQLILEKSVSELKKANNRIAEQKHILTSMTSELESVKQEREILLQRLAAAKESAVKAVKSATKKYDSVYEQYEGLKNDAHKAFAIVDEARALMAEYSDDCAAAREAHLNLETMLDENREYLGGTKTKALVRELENSCEKSHDVADLLRDKLSDVGAELIDAQARVAELQEAHTEDTARLDAATGSLLASSKTLAEVHDVHKRQQHECLEAFVGMAEAEARLTKANERVTELVKIVSEKNTQLEEARALHDENFDLRSQVKERDLRLTVIEPAKAELVKCTELVTDQAAQLRVAAASAVALEKRNEELEARLSKAEEDVNKTNHVMGELQAKLAEGLLREQAALGKCDRAAEDTAILGREIDGVTSELEGAKKELRETKENLQAADTRCQVLQQRFDDQSVTLRITKESNAEIQERLLVAETTHATHAITLEAATSKFDGEIAVLRQEVSFLKSQVQSEERRTARAEESEQESKRLLTILREQYSVLQAEVVDLRCLPSKQDDPKYPDLRGEVEKLTSQLADTVLAGETLAARTKTLNQRYESGHLDEDEKAFASSLINVTQEIYQQESVAKANELRRRDNTIKAQKNKIAHLESVIARHVAAQAKEKVTANGSTTERRSIVDVKSWIPSDCSSSPFSSPPGPPDDPMSITGETALPATAVKPPTNPPTSAPAFSVSSSLLPPPTVSVSSTKQAPRTLRISGPQVSTSAREPLISALTARPDERPSFTKLATQGSDDIDDFEDHRHQAPTTNLGKRDRMSSPIKGDQGGGDGSRPSRRLRATTRKPGSQMAVAESGGDPKPTAEAALKPTKTKKRK